MGGHLKIESELGEGSRFWFELPLTLQAEYNLAIHALSAQQCEDV